MSTDEKNVLNTIEQMTAAFHKGDLEGIMETYEKDALVVFKPKTPVSDEAQLRGMFQQMFPVNPKFTYGEHEVFVAGDIAIHFTPWNMTGKTPDGTELQDNGLSVAVLRRQENGEWLMVIDNPYGHHVLNG